MANGHATIQGLEVKLSVPIKDVQNVMDDVSDINLGNFPLDAPEYLWLHVCNQP